MINQNILFSYVQNVLFKTSFNGDRLGPVEIYFILKSIIMISILNFYMVLGNYLYLITILVKEYYY